jgi:hypothetical protein
MSALDREVRKQQRDYDSLQLAQKDALGPERWR